MEESQRPPPAQAVLFDLDGVLVHSYEAWFHLLNAAASEWGYPGISRELFHECWGQGIEADQQRFYPGHELAEIEAWYHAHFMDHVDHLRVDAEVPAVFEALTTRGLGTAVITNTPNPLAGEVVAHAGGSPDTIVGGTDVALAKPAPDMVFEACSRLGVEPARAWVVGDSRFDEQAARAAGTRFAGVGGLEGDATLGGLLDLLRYL